MQFQHGTPITMAATSTGLQAFSTEPIGTQQFTAQDINSGSGFNFLTSDSPTWTFTVQQLFVSWEGVTALGDIIFQNFLTVEEDTSAGNILIPCRDVAFGPNGLRVSNNSTGGQYHVTVFYTQTGA